MSMMTPPEDTTPRAGDTSAPSTGAFGAPNAPTVPDVAPASQGAPRSYGPAYGTGQGAASNRPYGGFGVAEPGSRGVSPTWPGERYAAAADYANAVPERMPRTNAVGMARRAKRWLIGTSVVAFLILAGLAAGNAVGVTAASNSSNTTPPGNDGQGVNNPNTNGDGNNPFFGGQGSQSGNSNVGPSTSQPPFGGSSVS